MTESVYLDYAATASVRPDVVADAITAYLRDIGATPGRSGHARALSAGRVALRCRQALAALFGIRGDPGRIAFQLNATHALNTALFGLLAPGQAVVRTSLDHNAARRPIAALRGTGVDERVLEMDPRGGFDRTQLGMLLDGGGRRAKVLVAPHASNVTGAVLPIPELAAAARDHAAIFVLDAAQTAGHYPVDVDVLGADVLAFTGHKGLLGPQGIGGIWVREGVDVGPLLYGGTGGDSHPDSMPAAYPDHLEAGTQNGPGMAGLLAALEWLESAGTDRLRTREIELRENLLTALRAVPGVEICSPTDVESVGIVTIRLAGYDPAELAGILDRRFGIQGRAGLHCAPEAHQAMGTLSTGAFRLSLGWATTEDEIGRAVSALKTLADEERK